ASAVLDALKATGIKAEQVVDAADLQIAGHAGEGASLIYERVFTPVDRMSSVLLGITLDELRGVWTGTGQTPNFTNIYASQDDLPELAVLLGQPGTNVKPTPAGSVAGAVWGDKMGLGILPFDRLTTRTRAIPLDGQSPVDNRFQGDKWPLTSRAYLLPTTNGGRDAVKKINLGTISNRDASRMTVLIMTGVTAMARNSAVAIENSGDWGFLAEQVGPELAAADITIISNEIPFMPNCKANNTLNNLLLCSKPEYWTNLELSGVDAIGLSGNHMNDFGYDNFRWTLDFYKEKKIPYYAGGVDETEARKPLILEQNGNRLGFLGANSWGPETYWNANGEQVSAWAGKDNPGAARFDLKQMSADIQALKPQVDLVFGEVQHTEFNAAGDYQTEPIPQQEADFRGMIDAGADVVTGVMAHAPQAVELRNGKLILYGLGNLYFDQTWSWPTRTGLVARHTIYKGKLINTELLVTVIEKNFQLRWATPEERMQVLKSVFDVSRW
ncbi:MAG: CapA family protein, partial [Nitrososphaerales archaeon]